MSSENIGSIESSFQESISASEHFEAKIFEWNDYRGYYFSQKNLDKSVNNEDVVFVKSISSGLVFGVCDGVGGHPMGQEAASIAAETVMDSFTSNDKDFSYLAVLEQANKKVRDLKVGACTTISFGVLLDDQVKFFSLGDSEIFFSNSRGSVCYYNIPQSPVGYGVEAGLISEDDSLDAPDRNIVSNLLGDKILRIESSSSINLRKGHSVFIGTDGVFDNITKDKLVSMVSSGPFEDSVQKVETYFTSIKKEESWRKNDDISFIILRKVRS